MKYIVLDLEVEILCPIGNNKASPYWPGNNVVGFGAKVGKSLSDPSPALWANAEIFKDDGVVEALREEHLIVGHNVAFDLQHMYNYPQVYTQRKHIRIWDTALAAYLLSRQQRKFPSLDSLCEWYGLPLKDSAVKRCWEDGVTTSKIPVDILSEYCKQDVQNTTEIFKRQAKELSERGMLPLFLALCESECALVEMMYNGLAVDKRQLNYLISQSSFKIGLLQGKLLTEAVKSGIPADRVDLNSPKSVSLILFGGKVKEKKKVSAGFYKNGKPKERVVEEEVEYKGFGLSTTDIRKTERGYAVDDETLKKLSGHPFVDILKEYREEYKDYSTYLEPTSQLIFPDGKIHHTLNNTATSTGRLSGSNPNLQNVTSKSKSEIKSVYVSRWGEDGEIVEADYKQLEVVALAYLSQDKQLVADVNAGVDIHTELYKELFHRTPNYEERRQFKRLAFALIYGAGAKSMAEQAGVSLSVAKNFASAFFTRYPSIKLYRSRVHAEVYKNRMPTSGGHGPKGWPLATSHIKTVTGRELMFKEYEQENFITKRPHTGFSYTEMCNYPVQSFATGDLVQIMLGVLYRRLMNFPEPMLSKCLLVNTVHDSVLLDVHKDVLPEAVDFVKNTLEDVEPVLSKLFNINDFNVKVRVEVTHGPNWLDQKEI